LPDVSRPGSETITHTHWILPIYHDDADGMITFLWQHGFDATRGASSMTVVPVDNPSLPSPVQAIDSFRRLLYLPFDGSMTDEEIQQLATAIRSYATQPVSPDGPNHPPPES
jgi:dTDP-4-amino-4,6-dideoxygalactose transaminase